jgi:hypothetical protein
LATNGTSGKKYIVAIYLMAGRVKKAVLLQEAKEPMTNGGGSCGF